MNKIEICKAFVNRGEFDPKIKLPENGVEPISFIQVWSYNFSSLLFKTSLEYKHRDVLLKTAHETRISIIRTESAEYKKLKHINGLFRELEKDVLAKINSALNVSFNYSDYEFYSQKFVEDLRLRQYNFPNHPFTIQEMIKIDYLPES